MRPDAEPQPAVTAPACNTPQPAPAPALHRLADDPEQRYWVYRPQRLAPGGGGLLVSVHGISRNAGAHARALAPLADTLGCVLVAPHFSRSRFPDYQRLGRPRRLGPGGRADAMLLRIVAAVRADGALATTRWALMGHSGGAQFALRFALLHAAHLSSYALSAAGSYCWPDTSRRFPHGLAPDPQWGTLQPELGALLRLPGLVLVGADDTQRDEALRQGARIDAQQGRTRLERAQRWVQALHDQGRVCGIEPPLQLQAVDGCGHGFSQLAASARWQQLLLRHFAAATTAA